MLLAMNFEVRNTFYRKWKWSREDKGALDVIQTISFNITAGIELRKDCLRPTSQTNCIGFVGHMIFHCHEMRLIKYIFQLVFDQL